MNYVMVIDTETANSIEQPLPYDFGWAIVEKETGKITVERSFVVAEIFLDTDLMSSAYYAEKIPKYWEEIKAGKRFLKRLLTIRKILWSDMKKYDCFTVGAYNMGFDKRASKNDARYVTSSFIRWFFPSKTKYFCIWNMACTSFLNTADYINFAKTHGFVSEAGNIQTSAECAYRYLKNNTSFIESHTGLEDVKIEIEIYLNCLKTGDENMRDHINSACWQKVQKTRKELEKQGF